MDLDYYHVIKKSSCLDFFEESTFHDARRLKEVRLAETASEALQTEKELQNPLAIFCRKK